MKQTARVEQAISRAEIIAERMGDDFIGTEHLLLAIAKDDSGIAAGVLDELGVRANIQARLESILESDSYNREGRKPGGSTVG